MAWLTARAVGQQAGFAGAVRHANQASSKKSPRPLDAITPVAQNFPRLILPRWAAHLETPANLLKLLERVLAVLSKCPLKLLDNQADFDSAMRRFESSRPSQPVRSLRAISAF
jgi:hypothetical protein